MSVGATLAAAREQAGLSLAQVSDRTMIRPGLIEAIEADDYHACGGDFYARGHIKSIAEHIGLDPAPLLAEFDAAHAPAEDALPTATGVLDVAVVSAAGARAERRTPNWTLAMIVALVAVLGFGAVRTFGGGDDGGTATQGTNPQVSATVDATDGADGTEPSTDATAESDDQPSTPPSDAIAAVPGDGVTVVLDAVDGRSWVSATGKDSGVLFQKVLDTGRQETFRDDQQVKLVVGNAGAVRLVVNGRDLGTPGAEGEVVRLTFGPGDPALAGG